MPTFDMTRTGTLLQEIQLLKPIDSFLVDTFFPFNQKNVSNTDEVYFDTVKGGRKIAPLVSPYGKLRELTRDPYSTDKIIPAKVGFSRSITPETVAKRVAGEPIFSGGLTPAQRAQLVQAQDMKDILDTIKRRQEHMIRNLLLTGKVNSIADYDEDTSLNIDYGMSADCIITLSGTDLWTNSSSDPIMQLVANRRKVMERSGIAPGIAFMGMDAWKAFRNNPNIKEKFWYNNPAFSFGQLTPRIMNEDITYLGRINEANLDLYLYDGWTIDPVTGISTQVVPDNAVIQLPYGADVGKAFSMMYGAVTYLDKSEQFVTVAEQYVPREFVDLRSNTKGLDIVSRSLPVINIVDSFITMYVC